MMFCDFLYRWPSLKQVKRARQATLRSFFSAHNLRRARLVEERINGIRAASALTDDPAVIRPHQLLVQALVAQLRVTLQAIDDYDAAITAVAMRLPDYQLFAGLPGAGSILAPRLLVAFGEQRERYRMPPISRITRAWRPCSSVAATRARFTGVWPVQPSCVKPLSNGLGAPSLARSGPAPTTSANARRDAHTTQLCDPWPTNGFASCTAAGRPERPTMNPST